MSPDRFTIDIPAGHPAFDGHFPGHPVLPGVVLLAEVVAGIEYCLGRSLDQVRFKVVKFHAPVGPGAHLSVELAGTGANADVTGIAFTVCCAGRRVATGTITTSEMPVKDGATLDEAARSGARRAPGGGDTP